MADEDDPHVVLEGLDQARSVAEDATNAAFQILMANPLDKALREDYFAKVLVSRKALEEILRH